MALNLFQNIRSFLVPVRENNYHPHALRRTALFSYSVFLLVLNLIAGQFNFLTVSEVSAAEISTTRLIELANQERSSKGLVKLKTNSKLTIAAKNKANDMFKKGYWSHFGPNGETPWQFILGSSYSYIYAGENLAKDFVTTDAIHSAWMASSTHRANILKGEYRDIGISAVTGMLDGQETTIVVQMFGTTSTTSNDVDTLPTTADTNEPNTADQIEAPVITHPVNDGFYNNKLLDIKGTVSTDGKEIIFYDKNVKVGSILVDGGAFDFRPADAWEDGQHQVNAAVTEKSTGVLSDKSKIVNFVIDTILPEVYEETIETSEVTQDGQSIDFTLSFEASSDVVHVYLLVGDEEFDLGNIEPNDSGENQIISEKLAIDEAKLAAESFSAQIVLRDQALNESKTQIDLSALSDLNGEVSSAVSVGSTSVFRIFEQVSSMSFISKVNIFVAMFVGMIFLLDAFALWRMGVIRDGAKSAFAPFMFMVVVLVGIFIGAGGSLI